MTIDHQSIQLDQKTNHSQCRTDLHHSNCRRRSRLESFQPSEGCPQQGAECQCLKVQTDLIRRDNDDEEDEDEDVDDYDEEDDNHY